MKYSIIAKDDGYQVDNTERSIHFSNAELLNVGCKNCVWALNGQCPYPLNKYKLVCPDMLHFLLSLADKECSTSAVWEKFHIYKARLQESADYKDYLELQEQIKVLESSPVTTESEHAQLEELKYKRNSAKIWWSKMNAHVILSLQKVVDREQKERSGKKMPSIFGAKTINFNITKEEVKQINTDKVKEISDER